MYNTRKRKYYKLIIWELNALMFIFYLGLEMSLGFNYKNYNDTYQCVHFLNIFKNCTFIIDYL